MKKLIACLMLFFTGLSASYSAYGCCERPDTPAYVSECLKAAKEKLRAISQLNGFTLDETTIFVSGIDDRWYNPSKYVWFSASVNKSDGASETIQVLTQKSLLPVKSCF